MGHVHVTAHHDGFLLIEPVEIILEIFLPFHSVVQSAKTVLRVRCVDCYEIEIVHLQRNHTSLMVVLVHADAIGHVQRLVFREDGRAGIAFLVSVVPV